MLGAAGALLGSTVAVAHADSVVPQPEGGVSTVSSSTDRVILRFEAGTSAADRAAVRDEAGAEDFASLGKRFQVLTLEPSANAKEVAAALRANPDVADATVDGYSVLHAAPNDPLFNQLWGLENTGGGVFGQPATAGADISALDAWLKTTGNVGVVVADLDTGYRPAHPDLNDALWTNTDEIPGNSVDDDGNGYVDDVHGMDFAGASVDAPVNDNDPTDDIAAGGHGVHTAGTIAAEGNNGIGITGVAQKATIMPLRVCGWSPSAGGVRCPFSSQIAAINYAGANGAKIANMSLGGTSANNLVRDAFAANPDVLYVISAGNDGKDVEVSGQTTYPCSFDPTTSGIPGALDNIVCVAASNQTDGKASFSNWGSTKVDIAAPGTETLSTYPFRTPWYETFSATGWPYTGWTAGGWTRVAMPGQTGQAITNDTATQADGTTRTVIGPTATVSGVTNCQLNQNRVISKSGSDVARYEVWVDGASAYTVTPSSSGNFVLAFTLSGSGSHTLQARFSYARSGGTTSNGYWVNNLSFSCWVPPGADDGTTDYGFLQGTSMAAPHVSGAAALLAAYEPTATSMQMKGALLTSVDPVATFSTTYPITTGGRLNANAALTELDKAVAPDTEITSKPSATSTPAVSFAFKTSSQAPTTYECKLDAGSFAACTSPRAYTGLSAGSHTFSVRAKDNHGNFDTAPATYTWNVASAPTVTGVAPSQGPAAGGTNVTVTGTGFAGTPTVTFGGTACSSVNRTSSTTLTCTTNARAAGAVTVTVTNPDTQSGSKANAFTYVLPAPTVTAVTPGSGPAAGGTNVTVTGTGFTGTPSVSFGGSACSSVNRTSSTSLTCTTTAHAAGAVTVSVTNPDTQSGSKATAFTYVAAPTVTEVTPGSGPAAGGTNVTVTGTGFAGTPSVSFGGSACSSVNRTSSTSLTCTTTAHAAGAVTVSVTNPDTQSGSKTTAFTFVAKPTIASISPTSGPVSGGTTITINGSDFSGTPTVTVNGRPCGSVSRIDASSATCVTPQGVAAGAVEVVLTNPDGQSASKADGFTYLAPVSTPDPGGPTPSPTTSPNEPITAVQVGSVSGLKAKRVGKGKAARLTWTAASNAVRYEFACAAKGKKVGAFTSVNATTAKCKKLKPSKAYVGYVRAVGADTFSATATVAIKKWKK